MGCCSIKSSAPRKIFHPFFHPNHPCQDENTHHRRLQEDRHRRQKTDTAARRHHTDTEGDRHLRLREDRHRHQKTSSTTPRRSTPPNPRRTKTPEEQSPLSSECREYFVSNITPPPPTPPPSKQKQKQKQIQSNFFHKQTPTKELLFFFNSFSIFSILFQNKGVTTGPLKFLCTQLHKNTLYPSTPYDIFVNIGSFPKSRLSQSKNFPFHPFKANQIKYSSTSCCRKLLSLFI